MKLISAITFLLTGLMSKSFACEVVAPDQINLAISTQYQEQIHYNSIKVLNRTPYSNINNCKMTAAKRRYVMLAVGVEDLILTNRNTTYSIADRTRKHSCRIENSELKSQMTYKELNEELHLKRKLLTSCLVTKVTELGPKPLQIPKDQVGCKIKRISDYAADFVGKFCYFKPGFNTNYNVQLDVNTECLTEKGLKEKNITAKDINAVLNIYTSDVATGKNNDLVAIGGTKLRFSVNPINKLVKAADDFGVRRPVFPAKYVLNDIHLAEPTVKMRGPSLQFKFPFVVDTRCERKCEGGLCSSPCDYAMPIVGEHILEVFENGKWEYIASWYDGAVANGQWQGILHGVGKSIQMGALDLDATYRVRIVFQEPNLDFKYFDGDITRRIFLNSNNIGSIGDRGRIGTIPLIQDIVNGRTVPEIEDIGELDFDNPLDGVQTSLRTFQSYLKNKFWPPLYEDVCSKDGKCFDNGKKFLELSAKFNIHKESKRKYKMTNVEFSKKSAFGGSYSNKKVDKFPRVNCSRQ